MQDGSADILKNSKRNAKEETVSSNGIYWQFIKLQKPEKEILAPSYCCNHLQDVIKYKYISCKLHCYLMT
jgi:hypothetical protein